MNSKRGFRGDLEGIRGIALLIILSTHLVEWPSGGHVALDLFFVLSGFLITGLLVREYQKTGTISISAFYRRRVRRLMPAASLVIIVTVIIASALFVGARALSVTWDAVWALLVVSNWNYALNGTDYFATFAPQSPLLHYWSLSVEEQYYLVWPLLMLAVLAIAARRTKAGSRSPRAPLYAVISVVVVASFAWGVIQPMTDPAVSYLSTLTRVWELALGALVFFATPLWKRIPDAVRPFLAWTGLVAILVAAVAITPELPYPSYWALIPVIATTMIIVAGVGGESRLWIATNPIARYLGQISYTTYLWHWPIFVFLATAVGKESPWYLFGAVPLSFAVAALTFHFIEDPIRQSSWLEPRSKRSRRRGRSADRRRATITVVATVSLVALAAVVSVAAVSSTSEDGVAVEAAPTSAAVGVDAAEGEVDAALDETVAGLQTSIVSALDATAWPDGLTPTIDEVSETSWVGEGRLEECLVVDETNESDCVFGDPDAAKTAVVLGDSVSVSWMPGIEPALASLGYRIQLLSRSLCPAAAVDIAGSGTADGAPVDYDTVCDDHRDRVIDRTIALQPDLIIVADAEAELEKLTVTASSSPETLDSAQKEAWQTGIASTLDRLAPAGGHVVLLASPPQLPSIQECATRLNSPRDCTEDVPRRWDNQYAADSAAVGAASTPERPVDLVDTLQWFCSAQAVCPPYAGGHIIRADRQHLTNEYAASLEGVIALTVRSLVAEPAPTAP